MGFKDFLARTMEKRRRMKEYEEDLKIQRQAQEKLKPANERELERFQEEERQEQIKKALEGYRKKQQKDLWHSNIFKREKSILAQDKSVLTDNKKLFSMRGNNLKSNMGFFK